MPDPISKPSLLAMEGGSPVIPHPPEKTPRWGEEELRRLTDRMSQSSLFYGSGKTPHIQTEALFEKFREPYPLNSHFQCWFRIMLSLGMDREYLRGVTEAVHKVSEHYRIHEPPVGNLFHSTGI